MCPVAELRLLRAPITDPARLLGPPKQTIPLVAFRVGRWGWTQWHVDRAVGALLPLCGMLVVSSARVDQRFATVEDWPQVCEHCRVALLRSLEHPRA